MRIASSLANTGADGLRRLKAAVRVAPLAWLLSCTSAEDPSPAPMSGDTGGGGNAGISAGASAAGASPPAGGAGSAAGTTSAGGSGGTAGSAGGSAGGAGSSAGASGSSAGSGGSGEAGSAGGEAGSAGSEAGSAGTAAPVTYPMLQADMIGMPSMVKDGFTLAESPLWDPCGKQLLFTDVQGGTGSSGVIHTLGSSGELGTLAMSTTNTNGIAYDVDGSLILSQMGGGGHLARRTKDGMIKTIEPAGGPNLHTPDDVIVRSDGTIYFSDGDFYPIGNLLGFSSNLPVFVLKPGGTALVNGGMVSGPNGIEFSTDEKTLYVAAYGGGTIVKFTVADDGSITKNGNAVTGLTNPDSFCLDAAGNFYIGVQTGLQIATADGTKLKLIPIPGSSGTRGTTSCTFGGEDGKTLYVTNWGALFKIDAMPIPGQDWLVNKDRVKCN